MKFLLILSSLIIPISSSFALYKSKSPTSKVTAPYLHIMDEQEKRDLKREHDLTSTKAAEEKVEERYQQRMEEKKKRVR